MDEALLAAGEIADVPARQRSALVAFGKLLARLRAEVPLVDLPELVDRVIAGTGYDDYLKDGTEEGEERLANVLEIRSLAEEHAGLPRDEQLPTFLAEVALVADVDEYADAKPAATLITLHAVKGLEFPVVFLTGMEEGVFPHARSLDDEARLEEERRLCYVGITRAMNRCYLSSARRRMLFGRTSENPPSRFLAELPRADIEHRGKIATAERDAWSELDWERGRGEYERRRGARRDATLAGVAPTWRGPRDASDGRASPVAAALPHPTEPSLAKVNAAAARALATSFRAGDHVRHPTFGEGIVVTSAARADDEEVTVAFPDKGVKKLMASFAGLARS